MIEDGLRLLRDAVKCTARGGQLVIGAPEALKASDGWFVTFLLLQVRTGQLFEVSGEFDRTCRAFRNNLQSVEHQMITPSFFKRPYSVRFNLSAGRPASTA